MVFHVYFLDREFDSPIRRENLEEMLGEDLGRVKELYFEATYEKLAAEISETLNVERLGISELNIESLDMHTYMFIVSEECRQSIQEEFQKRHWIVRPSGRKLTVMNFSQTFHEFFSHTTNSEIIDSSVDSKASSKGTIEEKCKEIVFKELIKMVLEKKHLRKCILDMINESSNNLEEINSHLESYSSISIDQSSLVDKISSLKSQVKEISKLSNRTAFCDFDIQRKTPIELRKDLLNLSLKVSENKETLHMSICNLQQFEFSNLIVVERNSKEVLGQIPMARGVVIEKSFDLPYELLKRQGVCKFCVIYNCTRISNHIEFGICEFGVLDDTHVYITNRLTETLDIYIRLKMNGKDTFEKSFKLKALKKESIRLNYKPLSLEIQAFSGEVQVSPIFTIP